MTYIVQLFTGAAGSVAFGILFHMKKKHLPLAALGGFLGWLLFIICRECWGGVFFPTLAAAFGIDLYAESRCPGRGCSGAAGNLCTLRIRDGYHV